MNEKYFFFIQPPENLGPSSDVQPSPTIGPIMLRKKRSAAQSQKQLGHIERLSECENANNIDIFYESELLDKDRLDKLLDERNKCKKRILSLM